MRRKTQTILIPLLMSVLCWLGLLGLIFLVDPVILLPIKLAPLWILLWMAVFYPGLVIIKKASDSAIVASAVTGFMVLRYLGIGNVITGGLLFGLVAVIEWWRLKIS